MVSTKTTKLTWFFQLRLWILIVSVLHIVISSFSIFQFCVFVDMFFDKSNDTWNDETAVILKFFPPNSKVITVVGMANYIGIIFINVGFISEVLKRGFAIKPSWLYFYSTVQTLTLFYYNAIATLPILIIGVSHTFRTKLAMVVIFESVFFIFFILFYMYMWCHSSDSYENKRSKQIFILGNRIGAHEV